VVDSFSLHAYQHEKIFASGNLSEDSRFSPHQKATRPYESIISIPLWNQGEVDGVLNVVATKPEAFNPVDRSYLALLGPIIDVARAATELDTEALESEDAPSWPDPGNAYPDDGPSEMPPPTTPH
jgi:GAF domain-containing protein